MHVNTYNRYFNKAIKYQEQGRYDKALKYFNRIAPYCNDPGVFNVKGISHMNLGQFLEASESFDTALRIDPMNPIVWSNKGDSFLNLGRFTAAIKCYDKSLELNPTNAFALNQKGASLENLGRFQDALKCYDEALEIDPFNEIIKSNKQNVLNAIENEEKRGGSFSKKTAFSDMPDIKSLERNRDMEGLINALTHEDVYIRRRAIKALGRLKDPKAIPAIKNAKENDEDHLVKKHAITALEDLKDLKIECPECKFNNVSNAIFCQECGYDLRIIEDNSEDSLKTEEIDSKCPNCGYENNENANFCSGCGNKLGSGALNNNDMDIIDVNNDSEEKIASISGIGPVLAKKAIQIRETKGGFESVEDFCLSLELKPHIAKNIESLIICKTIKKSGRPDISGRVVDF